MCTYMVLSSSLITMTQRQRRPCTLFTCVEQPVHVMEIDVGRPSKSSLSLTVPVQIYNVTPTRVHIDSKWSESRVAMCVLCCWLTHQCKIGECICQGGSDSLCVMLPSESEVEGSRTSEDPCDNWNASPLCFLHTYVSRFPVGKNSPARCCVGHEVGYHRLLRSRDRSDVLCRVPGSKVLGRLEVRRVVNAPRR